MLLVYFDKNGRGDSRRANVLKDDAPGRKAGQYTST
jgi:hypothetical protein